MKKWPPLISVSLVSILLGVFIGILVARNRNPDIPFNSEQWQAGNIAQTLGGDVDPFRHRMVNDLLKSRTLFGKSKKEIVSLLGEDGMFDDNKMYYWLNQKYDCVVCIDPTSVENLVLEFNSKGFVESAYVSRYVRSR